MELQPFIDILNEEQEEEMVGNALSLLDGEGGYTIAEAASSALQDFIGPQ